MNKTAIASRSKEMWALPFFALGWTAGTLVKLYRIANAALLNGWWRGSTL